MKEGTKSILFGSHSVIHSILVIIAWKKIYRTIPSFKEIVCIFLHDIGYFGTNHLSNKTNLGHAELGAKVAHWLFDKKGTKYRDLILGHSLTACKKYNIEPSLLERPDEYSFIIAPMWWMKLNHKIEKFDIPAEVWKKEVTKNFYSSKRVSGTELLNKLKENK